MFCKQCGTQLGENDKFCPGCGAPMADPAPAGPSYIDPDPGNPLLAAGRSPLFLAAVICASAVTLLQVISLLITVIGMNSYMEYVNWAYSGMDMSVASATLTFTVIFVSVSLVMSVLLCVGLWMTYAAGAQGKVSPLEKGLKLIKGTLMAQMIYMIVMLGLVAFLMLMLALAGGIVGAAADGYDYSYPYYLDARAVAGVLKTVSVVGLIVVAVVGTLMVIFYLKARKAVGCAVATAQTGMVAGAPSLYLIVMCFVIAVWPIFLVVYSLASPSEGMALTMPSLLLNAAQSILFGIVAQRWRDRVLAAA